MIIVLYSDVLLTVNSWMFGFQLRFRAHQPFNRNLLDLQLLPLFQSLAFNEISLIRLMPMCRNCSQT